MASALRITRARRQVRAAPPSRAIHALLLLALLSACNRLGFGYTPISDIVQKAGSYEGKTVKVRGKVGDVVQLPIGGVRYYMLREGDAELMVVPAENVPAMGEQVSVVGTVSGLAIVGGTNIGLLLTEQRRW